MVWFFSEINGMLICYKTGTRSNDTFRIDNNLFNLDQLGVNYENVINKDLTPDANKRYKIRSWWVGNNYTISILKMNGLIEKKIFRNQIKTNYVQYFSNFNAVSLIYVHTYMCVYTHSVVSWTLASKVNARFPLRKSSS